MYSFVFFADFRSYSVHTTVGNKIQVLSYFGSALQTSTVDML